MTILESLDSDLNYRPLPENLGLREFIEAKKPLGEEESNCVVEEFLQMWPNTPHILPENIRLLQETLLTQDIFLEYRLVKPFLTEGCWMIGQEEVGKDGVGEMVEKLLGRLEHILGPDEYTPSVLAKRRRIK